MSLLAARRRALAGLSSQEPAPPPEYAASGGEIEVAGGYVIHTFAAGDTWPDNTATDDDFVVHDGPLTCDILVVGPGGGSNNGISGSRWGCAGGGGEVVEALDEVLAAGTYPVHVGIGGIFNEANNSTAIAGGEGRFDLGGAHEIVALPGGPASGGNSGASANGNPPGSPSGTSSGGGGGDGGPGGVGHQRNGGVGTTAWDGVKYGAGGAGRQSGTLGTVDTPADRPGRGATSYTNGGPALVKIRYLL